MRSLLLGILLAFSMLITSSLASAETVAQFAAGGFRGPDDPNVNGFRFTLIYGENDHMSGFDMGILSLNESQSFSGFTLILGLHKLNGNMDGGAAFSLVNIHDGNDTGLNAAFVNKVNDATGAANLGFVNIASGTSLLDIGGLNLAKASTAQIGFVNIATELKGFQFGLLNIAENGFLPVFPIFNFPTR